MCLSMAFSDKVSNICFHQVLDMHAYEARQKDYALKGHRHFYFMTLNGSEVWICLLWFFLFPNLSNFFFDKKFVSRMLCF